MGFYGEMLWFDALGYGGRFWILEGVKFGLAVGGGLAGWLAVHGLTLGMPTILHPMRRLARGLGAATGVIWGWSSWGRVLLVASQVPAGQTDPLFGNDLSFYLFTLPFLDSLYYWLFVLALIGLGAQGLLLPRLAGSPIEMDLANREMKPISLDGLYRTAGVLLAIMAAGQVIERYHLLYSELGAVHGAGWTDVHIRLPVCWFMAGLLLALAIGLALPGPRQRLLKIAARFSNTRFGQHVGLLGGAAALVLGGFFLLDSILPQALQWLRVNPNEITLEAPYIRRNIDMTLYGFNLDKVEVRDFPAEQTLSRETVQANRPTLDNARLWDWRALDDVFKQFQEIRLYYEFKDVDVDRYHVDGEYRSVMVSAREMNLDSLPPKSQTFVNKRFKYTHGYGVTMAMVNEFNDQGLPNLLIKDIPPKSEYPSLQVEQPAIYYGELTDAPVYVNTQEAEFDFPRGDGNALIHYQGKGGVQLSSFWRKLIYGWMLDGTSFLLSGYPTPDSRVMLHRDIMERVRKLAPFLRFDNDPYVVLAEGKLYWIIDCYTASQYCPYSEPFGSGSIPGAAKESSQLEMSMGRRPLDNVNYVRNSVKVVVDAYQGAVDFYIFDDEDPLVRTWANAFPGLLKPRSEMPSSLEQHVRYPTDLLSLQGLVYAKYHMTDPAVFYNQEDLWVRATEEYYDQTVHVSPYYVMWRPPHEEDLQFVLIQPFTPKNRQVLIGWIAGMCDAENYGRFLAYQFPKERRILGPQQVETKIDQERFLSGQLSLWDQRGSTVIRGNVLALPVGDTILYVEPIYLRAETAAYPELRLVVVMHEDDLAYAETFDAALEKLLSGQEGPPPSLAPAAADATRRELVEQAHQAFQEY
ncbi:MAG: UPF0182 family protein, partial [Desulfovibrionaceae bacterium]